METVLVIPDIQAPFQQEDTLPFLIEIRNTIAPTRVVCIGDSLDMHWASRFTVDPDGYSPTDEHARGIEFLKKLYREFPAGFEVDSNHNDRLHKKLFDAGIPRKFWPSQADLHGNPKGWEFGEYVEIDGVVYEHGHKLPGGMYGAKRGAKELTQSVVMGHHHAHAMIAYVAVRDKMFFGMNVGCLIDEKTYAFNYARARVQRPTLSAGAVIEGTPVLFPMKLDKHRRWTGKL